MFARSDKSKFLLTVMLVIAVLAVAIPTCEMVGCDMGMSGGMIGTGRIDAELWAEGGTFIPRRALLILMRNANIKKISLPDYLGQMKLNMEDGGNEAA